VAGDLLCFGDGPEGAHRVSNDGSGLVRLLVLSTLELPVTAHYPDTGKLLVRDADGTALIFREADAIGFWDGEA
jgi:uncharacterized cupin superfamily protein